MKKFYSLFTLLVCLSFFIGFSIKPNLSQAEVALPPDVPDDIDLEQCAEDLTDYMNTVLEEVGDPQHAILTSIAFNLTSHFEWPLYQLMVEYGAKFDELDYMAGNAYNRYNIGAAGANIMAYDWYATQYGWKAAFGGMPMIFTEYGDFGAIDNGRATLDGSDPYQFPADYYTPEEIQAMATEFNRLEADERALYFAPLAYTAEFNQPEFLFHSIQKENGDLGIVITDKEKGGINAARQLDSGGGFAQEANNHGKYVLEIITGPDVSGVVTYINGLPEGMIPVIRSCWGSTCGMKDPLVLASFIKAVDSQVSRPWHVLVGPNEPLTDPWVSDACGLASDRVWEWEKAHCGDKLDPEYHSLRPYPGNPCPANPNNPVQKVLMCGNQITASETFKIYSSETKPDGVNLGTCEVLPRSQKTITFEGPGGVEITETVSEQRWLCSEINVNSTASLTVDLTSSELPVLGNTEDVPNALSGTNSLSFINRMNNYVSWYLQGVFQTGEEEYASPTDPIGVRNMIDYAGPIQKLLPQEVLRSQWAGNETIDLGDSHDQIVVCKKGLPEACYIDAGQNRVRKSSARSNPYSIDASYIPLSTTEDEIGQIRLMTEGASQPGIEEGNEVGYLATDLDTLDTPTNPYVYPEDPNKGIKTHDILFFPHARESIQLADILQRTYVPEEALLRNERRPSTDNSSSGGYIRSQLRREGWIDSDDGMPPIEKVEFDYNGEFCQVLNAYENPGDNLYGWLDDNHYAQEGVSLDDPDPAIEPGWEGEAYEAKNINAEVVYEGLAECEFVETIDSDCYKECRTANRSGCMPDYECEFNGGTWDINNPSGSCSLGAPGFIVDCRWTQLENSGPACEDQCNNVPACEVTGMASAYVEVESPWMESIFRRLVNGGMSIYRRIYPRLAANNRSLPKKMQVVVPGPEKFENIPAKTTAEYGMEHISGNQEYIDGSGEGLGGNPTDGKSTGDLYFPLLGSVHEYFFDDIQIALRPYGFNNQFLSPGEDSQCSINNSVIQSAVLEGIIASAANWAHVPVDVLVAVVRGEGCGGGNRTTGICQYTDAQVTQYSAAGAKDPRNCLPRGRASGPLQIYFDSVNWDPWKNAVNMGTGESRTPEICNIKDSIYAAAYIISAYYDGCANANYNVNSTPTNWSLTDKQRALTGWGQGCSAQLCSGVAGGFYCQKLDEWAGQTSPGECTGNSAVGATGSEEGFTE